jgi:GDPmannose 4,6-dehydratase
MKTALITGITGQDGSYLAELLLSKGYEVHGLVRRSSSPNTSRIDSFIEKLNLHYGDLSDSDQVVPLIRSIEPDEVYNLAAQSQVGISFEMPEYTSNITGLGTCRLLEAIRKNSPSTKFYQASSSEMFGSAFPPQNENTPFNPQSPYACSKLYSYGMVRNYRIAYDMFAVNGILFNHESPRRGDQFVTKKITTSVARIIAGKQKFLELGNLDAKRDWGFAPEYVEMMWYMMQERHPTDFVIGTGETNTVQDFVDGVFSYVGLDKFSHIRFKEELFRPSEVRVLQADYGKASRMLHWQPKVKLGDLIRIMMDADMRAEGLPVIGDGDKILKFWFADRWWKND